MTRPDLSTPEGRRAYGAELRGLAVGWRIAGLSLLGIGAVGIVMTARADAPWFEGRLGPSTLAAVAIGWICCLVAITKRTRYHRRRMAE